MTVLLPNPVTHSLNHYFFLSFFLKIFFGAFVPLFTGQLKSGRETGRERGNDMQQRATGEIKPGSAARGHSLCIWGACSTD